MLQVLPDLKYYKRYKNEGLNEDYQYFVSAAFRQCQSATSKNVLLENISP